MGDAYVEESSIVDPSCEETAEGTVAGEGEERTELSPADVRRNMKANILLDSMWATGNADLQLVLQPFLVFLHASNTIIGFVAGGALFMYFPGLFLSPWISRMCRFKKWYLYCTNALMIAPTAIIGLLAVFHHYLQLGKPSLLVDVVVLTMISMFFGGFCSLPAQEYLAACIPVRLRGRLVGYSFTIGAAAAVGVAVIAGWILKHQPKPVAFGYVLLMAWVIFQVALTAALFARELPTPVEKSPRPWTKGMLKAFWDDKPFVRATLLVFVSTFIFVPIFGFVNIYGFRELKMVAATAAVIQILVQVTAPSGHLTDKLTPARVLPYTFILGAAALMPPIFIHSPYGVYISVVLSALCISLGAPAGISLIFSLPAPEHRAGHYTIQMAINTVALSLGPVTMGYLCDILPYRLVFAIVAVVLLLCFPFAKCMLRTYGNETTCFSKGYDH
jgi:MFS family permease